MRQPMWILSTHKVLAITMHSAAMHCVNPVKTGPREVVNVVAGAEMATAHHATTKAKEPGTANATRGVHPARRDRLT